MHTKYTITSILFGKLLFLLLYIISLLYIIIFMFNEDLNKISERYSTEKIDNQKVIEALAENIRH